jgi:hypothetical protein
MNSIEALQKDGSCRQQYPKANKSKPIAFSSNSAAGVQQAAVRTS